MTEEIKHINQKNQEYIAEGNGVTKEKENCNFQENYNVFGIDDKPCCYLYHKYCDEIDNCYLKKCKRLEQENKALQAYKDINEDFKKAWGELNEKYKQLYSALEEISGLASPHCTQCSQIINIINEVL
jgi:hypothetical protein